MNKILKAIIIEDEVLAQEMLAGMLKQQHSGSIEVLACCQDIPCAVKAIRKFQPDVVFLDIELPGFSGLDLLNFFNDEEINFHIIFTTAYNQYAIQAFKLSAVDYLLKPISPDDLGKAIELLDKRVNVSVYNELRNRFNTPQLKNRLVIHTNQTVRFLVLDDILYLQAHGAYSLITKSDDEQILASKNIRHYEDVLSPFKQFLRCHRSYIVNMDHVSELLRNDGGFLRLKSYEIPISPEKMNTLRDYMGIKER